MALVRLKKDALEAVQQEKGWSDAELAERVGVSRSQIWRVKLPVGDSRRNEAGTDLIAGLLHALQGERSFDDLFEVEQFENASCTGT